MNDEIRVHLVQFKGRRCIYMRFTCPQTGRQITRSTGTSKRRDAERAAGAWERQLVDGTYCPPSRLTWQVFRQRYETEVLPSLADRTAEKVGGIFDALERIVSPARLRDLTSERLSTFQSRLRDEGRSENTIAGYVAHLKASLNWAHRMGLLALVPKFTKLKRTRRSHVMKGRPITLEEFERMLSKTESVLHKAASPRWRYYLRGLWLSGLRLGESLQLSWDDESKLHVDFSGKYPMLRIPAELEKGHKDRLLPITPDFAELLEATPENERTGYVFHPQSLRNTGRLGKRQVGILVAHIGKKAGVKVHTDPRTGKVKFATAHDLRRSFGERWSVRVMPQVLKELMRHETIDTTLKYYVGRNAQTTAKALWEAHQGNTSGNTPSSGTPQDSEPVDATS